MTKKALSIILAAVLLLSVFTVLPMAASATTVTRIDEFRFAANPNYLALKSNRTAGAWLNNLKESYNGVGYGVSAAADTEGWKVNDIWGIYDGSLGRLLKDNEYPDPAHDNWLRVSVSLTDPDNYVFNGNSSYTFPAYVNGLRQGGSPLDIYSRIDIRLYSYAYVPYVAFTVKEPMFGDQCSKYAPAVDTTMPFMLASRIQITNWYWAAFDPYTHWPEEVTTFSDPEADYGLIIDFTTDDGYHFSSAGTVIVNGTELGNSQHGDGTGKTITSVAYHTTPHYTVSGKFTSFLNGSNATFISLMQNGETKYSTNGYGNNEISYSISGVAPGTFTMRVSKTNHATRDYEITVSGNTTQDVKIHPLGDINGDGVVNNFDYGRVNSHARGKSTLTGYDFACGDINGDGNVNNFDAGRVNSHARGKSSLWS